MRRPAQTPEFAHLLSMTDHLGIFEHAEITRPRIEHGYCTDDVARALVVMLREPDPTPERTQAAETYLRFLESAVHFDGKVHNRMSPAGTWTDAPGVGDWWGRAVAALGWACRYGPTPSFRERAERAFLRTTKVRTPHVRSASFAAAGAAEVVRTRTPATGPARALLADCLDLIPRRACPGWEWPEPRLTYANAALPDALILGGSALGQARKVQQGLSLLTVLVRIETTADGRLSVTGTKGRSPGETGPLWDQQPIEVAAIADACSHALAVTGDLSWRRVVEQAWAWFCGANDSATPLYDSSTGAGCDGLEPHGRNQNCGAESTLAAISTLQRRREVQGAQR